MSDFKARAVISSDFNQHSNYNEAASGVIKPGKIARSVFQDKIDFGLLFAYCFRRFGLPNNSSDSFKEIASYLVTTPVSGLFLVINIKPFSDPGLLFGYMMDEASEVRLNKETRVLLDDWHKNFKEWRTAQGISLPRDLPEFDSSNYSKDMELFSSAMEAYISSGGSSVYDIPKDSEVWTFNEAIKVTLEDLKTPVGVRDSHFSADAGKIEFPMGEGNGDDFYHDIRIADHHTSAGIHFPSAYLESIDNFFSLTEKLEEIGAGSLVDGIDKFINLH